ncbi:MAG: DUF2306 domain-containing protein [Alphaproteobacteria bacterium]
MAQAQAAQGRSERAAAAALKASGMFWFAVAVIGQWTFVYFIGGFYGPSTLTGQFENWNVKPLIDGHIPDDLTGNLMFGAHVLMAGVITLGGTLQLIPALRNRARAFHRWNGRLFLVLAVLLALGGLWLVWVRGTYFNLWGASGVSLNGVLILVFAALAWRFAVRRDIESHRRWAMRTFIVVSGVWFLRVFIMAWVILNAGPVGMGKRMDGPVDAVFAFGHYLIPLAFLELYFWAQNRGGAVARLAVAGVVVVLTGVMAVGIFGAYTFMWSPYL